MIIRWLLARSAEYRAAGEEIVRLREALQAATSEKLLLQDRLDSALGDKDRLWAMTRECINYERTAYHMQVNTQWQKQGFGAPYPDDPKLPPNVLQDNGGGSAGVRPVLASTRVKRAMAEFVAENVTNGIHSNT